MTVQPSMEDRTDPPESPSDRSLSTALVLIGICFLLVYPLMEVWPSGWVWLPRQYEYEQMMIGVYGTLGVFLIWASRKPEAHLSLIWFTFWSSLVHGAIMGTQAMVDPSERGHLMGDVAVLFIVAVVLGVLTPRRVVTGSDTTRKAETG